MPRPKNSSDSRSLGRRRSDDRARGPEWPNRSGRARLPVGTYERPGSFIAMRRGSGVAGAGPERLRPRADHADAVFLAQSAHHRAAEGLPVRGCECPDRFPQPVARVEVAHLHGILASADPPVELQKRLHLERKHRECRHQTVGKGDAAGVERVRISAEEILCHAKHAGHLQMPAEGGGSNT